MRTAMRLAAIVALVLTPGCSDDDDFGLIGPEWVLQSATDGATQLYPGPFAGETTVRFSSSDYAGFDGCSAFGGALELTAFGTAVVPSDQWRDAVDCPVDGYYPPHFGGPFGVDVRGGRLTVTVAEERYVYEPR